MNTQERTTATRPGKITATHLTTLGSRLTDRDRQIALDCYDHRVLTTAQLMRLHFGGLRTTNLRLGALYQLRVLDRFRPPRRRPRTGTNPYHWILDEAGAHVVAAQRDMERRRLRWQHSDAVDIAHPASSATTSKSTSSSRCSRWKPRSSTVRCTSGMANASRARCSRAWCPTGTASSTSPTVLPCTCCSSSTARPSPRDGYTTRRCSTPDRYREASSASATHSWLTVPTATRAKLAREAVAGTGAPIAVAEWSKASTHSPLAILTDAAERIAA
jgi:hypothetical protein